MFIKGYECVIYPEANKYAPQPKNESNASKPCANYTGLSGSTFADNLHCKFNMCIFEFKTEITSLKTPA